MYTQVDYNIYFLFALSVAFRLNAGLSATALELNIMGWMGPDGFRVDYLVGWMYWVYRWITEEHTPFLINNNHTIDNN